MRKRFIGPPNVGPDGQELGHEITVAGRDLGNVKPGQVIDIPDDLVAPTKDWPGVAFPPQLWEDAPAETKRKGDG